MHEVFFCINIMTLYRTLENNQKTLIKLFKLFGNLKTTFENYVNKFLINRLSNLSSIQQHTGGPYSFSHYYY